MPETENIANYEDLVGSLEKTMQDNPYAWGMVYCKHHFRQASPPFHLKILQEAINNQFFAVASPRGSAKSTIVAFLIPLHAIIFKKRRFILIVSNTYKKAASSLDTIRKEIVDNPKVKEFVNISLPREAEGDTIFRHPDGFETRVLCKGNEQLGSVRGEKFGAYRPDLIIVDDLEDDELVKNPERRRSLKELFDDALVPAGERGVTQYLVIGTILHDDSLMSKLVSKEYYPEYRKLLFKALVDGKSLWPEKWTVEWLEEYQKMKPDTFAKEYQNNPVSGLMQKFHKEHFRYWRIDDMRYYLYGVEGELLRKGNLSDCRAAIACDLAWEEKRQADFTVILPAYLTPHSDILIDSYIAKKGLRPNEIAEILFSMVARYKDITKSTVPIGFEKGKLEKVVNWFLQQEMRKRNTWLVTKALEWHGDKIERVTSKLQPRYYQHTIFHKRDMGELEHQLIRFPSAAHDDLPDALQGVIQLLEFPKKAKIEEKVDDTFMRLRQFAIDSRFPKKSRYIFGKKVNRFEIPAKISILE